MKLGISLLVALTALSLLGLGCSPPALAWGWGKMVIQDGSGEEVVVKHGLFGNNTTYAQDRLGDRYLNKKGLLGTRDQGVSLLGNSVEKKRGLLGGSEFQASTIFGDKIQSKKSLFTLGMRTTNINVGGLSQVAGQLLGGKRPYVPYSPAAAGYGAGAPGSINGAVSQSSARGASTGGGLLGAGQSPRQSLVNPDSFSNPPAAQTGGGPFQP